MIRPYGLYRIWVVVTIGLLVACFTILAAPHVSKWQSRAQRTEQTLAIMDDAFGVLGTLVKQLQQNDLRAANAIKRIRKDVRTNRAVLGNHLKLKKHKKI